jgi:hypothetical protein
MDVSELRKQIIRALDEARKDASARRQETDRAREVYETFLTEVAAPVFRHASSVLRGLGHEFTVNTPAGSVRLESPSANEFIELELDAKASKAQVLGRVALMRNKGGPLIEERPVVANKAIADLTEEDVAKFLTAEIPRLVMRP